jgi:hypothetical protein
MKKESRRFRLTWRLPRIEAFAQFGTDSMRPRSRLDRGYRMVELSGSRTAEVDQVCLIFSSTRGPPTMCRSISRAFEKAFIQYMRQPGQLRKIAEKKEMPAEFGRKIVGGDR